MTADEFVGLVKELRELGAVKVRSGELEAVFATVHAAKPDAPLAVAVTELAPPQKKTKVLRPGDMQTEEQRRLRQLAAELGES